MVLIGCKKTTAQQKRILCPAWKVCWVLSYINKARYLLNPYFLSNNIQNSLRIKTSPGKRLLLPNFFQINLDCPECIVSVSRSLMWVFLSVSLAFQVFLMRLEIRGEVVGISGMLDATEFVAKWDRFKWRNELVPVLQNQK